MYSFELRPNSSLTPRAAVWVYMSIVAVSLFIATGFAFIGYWPVLPFAGLELAGLGWALALCRRRGEAREQIVIEDGLIFVRKSHTSLWGNRSQVEYKFQRPWTRIELRCAEPAHWRTRLVLRSRGWSVEVGAFLTDGERDGLNTRLSEVLASEPLRAEIPEQVRIP